MLPLGRKTSLNKFQGVEIIQGLFSDHSRIKLETNNKKIPGKILNIWKLGKLLLAYAEDKKKITGEI